MEKKMEHEMETGIIMGYMVSWPIAVMFGLYGGYIGIMEKWKLLYLVRKKGYKSIYWGYIGRMEPLLEQLLGWRSMSVWGG